ncbi:hypothetical protein LRS05_16360 [Flavobacterium sp. J372]|uniref:hypothetical protein n=1 Tax=Flavobacterium sp. J372 TaxID=2898436 RepID=UPI002151CCEF|nr:hypothetical protein [Flavobacterium sp. J372]MCR5863585.1 hypothetical protein [Flavobacterium sp. J372]
MEYNSPFDSFELQVSAAARDYLKTAAKWAMFLAIIGFIGIAFMVLAGLFVFAAGGALSERRIGCVVIHYTGPFRRDLFYPGFAVFFPGALPF